MDSQPLKIPMGTPLADVITLLAEQSASGAVVVNVQGELKGFVSEKDCLKTLLVSSYHCDQHALVEDVMKHDVCTANADDSIIALAQQMAGNKPKIYPVIEAGKLVGVINRRAVLRALGKHVQSCGAW